MPAQPLPGEVLTDLTRRFGALTPVVGKAYSAHFTYASTRDHFVVMAPAGIGRNADRALAYGLTHAAGRRLVLVLPAGFTFATAQRIPWLTEAAQPLLLTHDGAHVEVVRVSTRQETIAALHARLQPRSDPAQDLRELCTPYHLGDPGALLQELEEWASRHPELDAAHRKSQRCWQYRGQRVLSATRSGAGVTVRAEIHRDAAPARCEVVSGAAPLTRASLAELQERVAAAIDERARGRLHKPDEHWLQAVIRRRPELVGVEQPALREVPAWRPRPAEHSWGQGYVDLLGLDGGGDLRIVEAKLAANKDAMFVLQGLDYYVWARAYREALCTRLGAAPAAALEVHYVVGATPQGVAEVSPYAAAQAAALDIPWRAQVVEDWFDPARAPRSTLLPSGTLPGQPVAA